MVHGPDIKGTLSVIAVGIAAIALGCKGFTGRGIPLSKTRFIGGRLGEMLGAIAMLIGAALICFALYATSKGW